MMFLRSFARPVLLVWLLAFALLLAGPASVYAKVQMVNGRDGAEGDPGDSFGAAGGGGGGGGGDYDPDGDAASAGSRTTLRLLSMPMFVVFDPRLGLPVILVIPIAAQVDPWEMVYTKGGAK